MKQGYRKVTLKDVAQCANVSYASVSAVLNGKDGQRIRVSEKTKKNILDAAVKLGYLPDVMARSLKNGKSSLIAVFTYEKLFPVQFRNEFYGFFMGIEETAEKLGYDLLIVNRRPAAEDKFSRTLLADGAVVIGIHKDSASIKTLVKHHFPIVFVGRREIEGIPTRWITFDYEGVIRALVAHVSPLCSGRTIAFVEDAQPTGEAAQDKNRFFHEAAAEAGLVVRDFTCGADNFLSPTDFARAVACGTVILSRLKLIEPFEMLCKKANLVPGRGVFCAVLEDDWSGSHGGWTRWTDRRAELGAASVALLSRIIGGNLAELPLSEKNAGGENSPREAIRLELISSATTGCG